MVAINSSEWYGLLADIAIRLVILAPMYIAKLVYLFILVINQIDAQNLFYNKYISCLYMFPATCAHRQEVKIVLYSI